jgi:uncharacterized small protein (DUF1192 family)
MADASSPPVAGTSVVSEKRLTVRLCAVSGLADRGAIEGLISEGRASRLSSREIAERVAAMFDDPAWAKAVSHPLRADILRLLRAGPLSPVRASESLGGATLRAIVYHFRYLEKLGLVEVGQRVQRRGAVEHVYRLKPGRS